MPIDSPRSNLRFVPRPVLAATLLALGAGTAPAGGQALGEEFQVNSFTEYRQYRQAVSTQGDAGFVVVWSSYSQDTSDSFGVFGQRFTPLGAPAGSEFPVNTYTTGTQWAPAVDADAAGTFVVVWSAAGGQDGDEDGIFGQRFGLTGTPMGGEFQVNGYTTSMQYTPAVAMDASGDFVVVWASYGPAGGGGYLEVRGRRFDSAGVPGSEFPVNTGTVDNQRQPVVAGDDAGNFVVVWTSYAQDGSGEGIFARRFDSAGAPQGGEFQVNTYTTGYQQNPAVASDAAGNFVVAWDSFGQDGSITGIFARRYDSTGTPQGGEFQVNSYTTDEQSYPAVVIDGDNGFLVTWDSFRDALSKGIYGRRFGVTGAPQGGEFQINTYTTSQQTRPVAAPDASGNLVVVWESSLQDGSDMGIFAQRIVGTLFGDGFETGEVCRWSDAVGGGACP